jgi:hypothetical protein
MPSIELLCIDQQEVLEFSDLPFALIADSAPRSHRTLPLFRTELSRLHGCMYHVGNPQCSESDYQGAFFAYEVLTEESRHRQRNRYFEISPQFRDGFRRLILGLLDSSPAGSVFFYTDWQFGPKKPFRGGVVSESEFWREHDTHRLKLNGCYTIQKEG